MVPPFQGRRGRLSSNRERDPASRRDLGRHANECGGADSPGGGGRWTLRCRRSRARASPAAQTTRLGRAFEDRMSLPIVLVAVLPLAMVPTTRTGEQPQLQQRPCHAPTSGGLRLPALPQAGSVDRALRDMAGAGLPSASAFVFPHLKIRLGTCNVQVPAIKEVSGGGSSRFANGGPAPGPCRSKSPHDGCPRRGDRGRPSGRHHRGHRSPRGVAV